MAHSAQESLLEKLLKSCYPLTHYLSRQQQFVKVYSTTQNPPVPHAEPANIVTRKRKSAPPPAIPCFDIPDTLDPDALEYNDNPSDYGDNTARDKQITGMNGSSEMEDDDCSQEFDETLLKSINNRINDNNSDNTNEKLSSIIKRSSAIQLEFSPMEYEFNSPLRKAIQNGLNIINK